MTTDRGRIYFLVKTRNASIHKVCITMEPLGTPELLVPTLLKIEINILYIHRPSALLYIKKTVLDQACLSADLDFYLKTEHAFLTCFF